MLAVQFRATRDSRSPLQYQRVEDLTQQLKKSEQERDALGKLVRDLRQAAGQAATVDEIEAIKLGTGLLALQGKGVIVTVDDTKSSPPAGIKKPNLYLTKDEDLLKIVNELRAAGSEAISINGQRLIATSEIRSAGAFISINNANLFTPFEIKAIGDPTTLENSLKMRGGVIETLQFWSIRVTVQKQDKLLIPAYKGSLRFIHAAPVPDESKTP
jgi:uncharacterized protein YlxW (UPF0749 family)